MIILLFTGFCSAEQTVRLCIDEWGLRFSKSLKHNGVVARIVSEAFSAEKIRVEYVFRPWKRCLGEAKHGTVDGTPGWLKNDERVKHYFFSEKIAQNINAFFYLKGTDFDWYSVDDLARYSIGVVNGYFYGDDIKSAEENGKISLLRSLDDNINFKQLFNRRVDAILCESEVAQTILTQHYQPTQANLVLRHPKFQLSEDLFLLLSKKNPDNRVVIEKFNLGLKKLAQSGLIKQFYAESFRGEYNPD